MSVVWQEHTGNAEKHKKQLMADLEQRKKLKSNLLRAKLNNEVLQADYEVANAEFSREIADLERQLRETEAAQADADCFIHFADPLLRDIEGAWRMATPEQRVSVRNLLFQEGLTYKPDSGISNTSNPSLYNVLMVIAGQQGEIGCPPGIRTPIC